MHADNSISYKNVDILTKKTFFFCVFCEFTICSYFGIVWWPFSLYKSLRQGARLDKTPKMVYNISRSTGMVLLIKRPHLVSLSFPMQCLHLLSAVSLFSRRRA